MNNIDQLNPRAAIKVHSETLLVQPLFRAIPAEKLRPNTFMYDPCWALLEPGMTMETHRHNHPEFYVFVKGSGTMTLNSDTFDVEEGMAVNIPPNTFHSVTNNGSDTQNLIWVSISLLSS